MEEASKPANVPPEEAAEASKISSRRLQNGGPREPKWAPGGLLGVEKASFEAKAVFEAFLEAFLRLLGPPLGPPKSTKRAFKLALKSKPFLRAVLKPSGSLQEGFWAPFGEAFGLDFGPPAANCDLSKK